MPYTNQCFLVEVATSTSCSMHTQVVNFHIVMEIWLGQSLDIIIYFNRWPLDDYDDCILVVQTYKKLHIVIYDWPLTTTFILVQHEPKLISSMQATVIR